MPTALLTGTPGAVLDAVAAALGAAGFATRHVPAAEAGAAGSRPADAVVHVGVRTPRDADEQERTRAETAGALAASELARVCGARRLVHVSTVAVYGRPRELPCREGALKAPRSADERVRWRAEQASWSAFRRGAPLTVLRPALLYGPTLRGGPLRTLSLLAAFHPGRRHVPIIRRGPVAHLLHLDDLARAVAFVARHPDDRAVVGRAFNVGDEAPLPLAEHLAPALEALGYRPGRVLPGAPRLAAALLWLFRHVPDPLLFGPFNRRLATRWRALAARSALSTVAPPQLDREALLWMSADHYYDMTRLGALGWRPLHAVSTGSMGETIRALVSSGVLPGSGIRARGAS